MVGFSLPWCWCIGFGFLGGWLGMGGLLDRYCDGVMISRWVFLSRSFNKMIKY
jgi:hypothetical protein